MRLFNPTMTLKSVVTMKITKKIVIMARKLVQRARVQLLMSEPRFNLPTPRVPQNTVGNVLQEPGWE